MTAAGAVDDRPRPRRSPHPAPRNASRPPAAEAASDQAPSGTSGGLAERAQTLIITVIDKLAAVAADKVEDLADSIQDAVAEGGGGLGALLPGGAGSGGVLASALMAGGLAKLEGKNPVWAGIKGAVGAMSTTTKVVTALLLILTAVLAPVALLVLALVLLVAAIVGAVSS